VDDTSELANCMNNTIDRKMKPAPIPQVFYADSYFIFQTEK
jgi:hypothetical protein